MYLTNLPKRLKYVSVTERLALAAGLHTTKQVRCVFEEECHFYLCGKGVFLKMFEQNNNSDIENCTLNDYTDYTVYHGITYLLNL